MAHEKEEAALSSCTMADFNDTSNNTTTIPHHHHERRRDADNGDDDDHRDQMTTKEEEIRRLSVRVAEMERTLETLQAEASDMMETLAVSQADMLIMYRRLQQISLALDESIHLLAEVNEGCRVFQKAYDETCAEKALQKDTHRELVASMNQTMDALMERNRQMQMQGLTMVGLCYQNAQRKKTTKEPERRMATTKGKRKNNDKDEEEDDKKRSNKRMMKTKQQKGEGSSSSGYDENNDNEGEDSSVDDDKKNEGGELFVIASDTFKNKVFFGYGDEDTDDFITRLNKAALLCMPGERRKRRFSLSFSTDDDRHARAQRWCPLTPSSPRYLRTPRRGSAATIVSRTVLPPTPRGSMSRMWRCTTLSPRPSSASSMRPFSPERLPPPPRP